MATFSTNNTIAGTSQGVSSLYQTQVSLSAATGVTSLRRDFIYQIIFGAQFGANAGYGLAVNYDISRIVANGTATLVAPSPLDQDDTPAGVIAAVNYTAEPAITPNSSLFSRTLNQNQTGMWVAYGERAQITIPAVNLSGVALRARSDLYAGLVDLTVFHSE